MPLIAYPNKNEKKTIRLRPLLISAPSSSGTARSFVNNERRVQRRRDEEKNSPCLFALEIRRLMFVDQVNSVVRTVSSTFTSLLCLSLLRSLRYWTKEEPYINAAGAVDTGNAFRWCRNVDVCVRSRYWKLCERQEYIN